MKPWQIKLTRYFHLSLEMVLLFLIAMPFYFMEGKELPTIAFSILVATAIIFYDPFIQKFKTEKVGLFLIPIITIVGMSVGYHFFFSLLIATIVFGRVLFHNKDNDPNEMSLFIATFVIGVVFYLHFFYLGSNEWFLLITLLQFFLVITLKTLKLTFQSSKTRALKWVQLKWQLGSVAALGAITTIAFFSYELIHNMISFILKIVILGISLLGVPFVYLASLLNFELRRQGPKEEGGFFNSGENQNILDEATVTNLDWLPWIFGAIALIVMLFFIFKRSGPFILREYIKTNDQENLDAILHEDVKKNWFRSNRPKNEIRRLFYDFEKYMAKHGEGRKFHETIEDWFSRVNASQELKDYVARTYRNVRYGNQEISKDDKERYRRSLKEIKKKLKMDFNNV
ncbi:hypothetical protein H1D32_05660 [Anaerobacillus sp. CMMVII]|uniref:hypothetical protein n=1 Tax=Anaerobacillus sp. CMMVII TaxID=2755588 RepID=UPI0021B7F60F|nr:hypothetical protein [Anaerobacillus sp. CMMVII]MCT8137275.1 hypothetical protein [Anaerobacillus sp. CMMVII]